MLPKGLRRARNFGFLHPNSARAIRLLQVLHLRTARPVDNIRPRRGGQLGAAPVANPCMSSDSACLRWPRTCRIRARRQTRCPPQQLTRCTEATAILTGNGLNISSLKPVLRFVLETATELAKLVAVNTESRRAFHSPVPLRTRRHGRLDSRQWIYRIYLE